MAMRRTIKLNEQRQLGAISVDMVLQRIDEWCFALRNSSTPSAIDLDPIDTIHVGYLECGNDLGGNLSIIHQLGRFDLLGQSLESVGTESSDSFGDTSRLCLLQSIDEGG